MALHVKRQDGTIAGFDDKQHAQAHQYAEDIGGEVIDFDAEQEGTEPEEGPAPESENA